MKKKCEVVEGTPKWRFLTIELLLCLRRHLELESELRYKYERLMAELGSEHVRSFLDKKKTK